MRLELKHLSILFALLFASFYCVSPSFAATAEPAWKFNRSFNTWTADLNAIETRYNEPNYVTERAEEYRAELLDIRTSASLAREQATEHAANTQDLLEALGPRPAEDEPEEGREVAEKRQKLEAEIADYRGRAAQAQLIVRRVDALVAGLTAIEQGQAVRTLLTRNPSPLALTTLVESPSATWAYLSGIAATPFIWWQEATEDEQERLQGPAILLSIVLLIAAALGSRRALVWWIGRDETIAEPSYTRRLLGASAEALANGLLPALFAAVLWISANRALGLEPGATLNLINGLVAASLIIIAVLALPRAALSPGLPNWRVAPIKPKYAKRMTSRISVLGILFGIDVFIGFTAINAAPAFLSIYSAIFASLEAVLILDLVRPALWRADPEWQSGIQHKDAAAPASEQSQHKKRIAWRLLRLTIGLIAIAGAATAWVGYTALSNYLIGGLIASALVVGALFLLKALFAEWISILMGRKEVIDWLNLSETGSATVKFWLVGLLEVLIYICGAVLIGATWGLPLQDIWTLAYNLMTAIEVGGVTISIADIFEALFVFAITLIIFRLGKQLLRDTILPQTRLDAGAQYSITTIFGYVGLVTAFVLGAAALGVEFQNLIIIAGALSVGIGFGLQNIANNFISGLILLFERPIKVGDLIEIGETLGHVTHINVRRTEVETFQRAEVMIPNSELVATSVINWTHSDRKARVEINVGVAYGSDTDLVRTTLLEAAKQVDRIVSWPAPDVLFLDFGDSSLNFQLRCFTNDVSSRITTASTLRFEIDRLFRKAGLEIPFPQRVVHMAPTPPAGGTSQSD
jgi:potassium-dependent mechanosensitive channel